MKWITYTVRFYAISTIFAGSILLIFAAHAYFSGIGANVDRVVIVVFAVFLIAFGFLLSIITNWLKRKRGK